MTTPTKAGQAQTGAEYTRGPWKYRYEGSGDYEVYAESTKDEIGSAWSKDAHFLGMGPASEQNKANARLIAAAPELLQACKALLEATWEIRIPDHPTLGLAQSKCQKAIQVAEGRTP